MITLTDIKKFSLLLLLLASIRGLSQDPHFSQFYNFPLFTNPANTGDIKGPVRAVLAYRTQWRSVAVPYTTQGCSVEGNIYKDKRNTRSFGAGLMVISDKVGEYQLKTNGIVLSLAGAVKPDPHNSIAAGLQGGFSQKRFDPDKLRWGNQYNGLYYDAHLSSGEQYYFNSVFYTDLAAGLNWDFDQNNAREGVYSRQAKKLKGNFGVAMYHINRPNTTLNDPNMHERIYRKLTVNGSMVFSSKGSDVSVIPSFLFEWQGPTYKTNLGFMTRYLLKEGTRYVSGITDGKAFSLGAFYRYKDAFVISTLYEYHQFAFGISYDINISRFVVATSSRGGLELTLRYMSPQRLAFQKKGSRSLRMN